MKLMELCSVQMKGEVFKSIQPNSPLEVKVKFPLNAAAAEVGQWSFT